MCRVKNYRRAVISAASEREINGGVYLHTYMVYTIMNTELQVTLNVPKYYGT